MRILLVAPSINPVTYKGLGKYCKQILEGMQRVGEVDLVQKISEQDKVISTSSEIPLRLLYRRFSRDYDVVHALSPDLGIYSPFIFENSVVTFHDLIPILAFREMRFQFSQLMPYYTQFTWRMAARARKVIANSTQTRDELVHLLDVKPEKIQVIPLGVDDRFRPAQKKNLNRPVIGFFGNYTFRKRVDIAVSAFKLISQEVDADLILAGGEIQTMYQKHFDMQNLTRDLKHVKLLGHVAEENLPSLYNSFDVMLFPSLYEGFGLPIVEAQRCGIPVLILRDARIPDEVKQETFVCEDAQDMAQKALELLKDDGKKAELVDRASVHAARFTWDRTIAATMKIYRELSEH